MLELLYFILILILIYFYFLDNEEVCDKALIA